MNRRRPMMIRHFQSELKRQGFDLCHPIHTSWYNNLIKEDGLVENGSLELLPEPPTIVDDEEEDAHVDGVGERISSSYNALLIGNTKHIWPIFINWLSSKIDRIKEEGNHNGTLTDREALDNIKNPFDTFVVESIHQAIERCGSSTHPEIKCCELFWSSGKRQTLNFDQSNESNHSDADLMAETKNNTNNYHCYCVDDETSFLVSMQRVATTTGKYWLDTEATKLCIHPEYGTWTAFRTLVLFETRGDQSSRSAPIASPPPPPLPSTCTCPVSSDEIRLAKEIFDYALDRSSSSETQGYGTTVNKSWKELCDYIHDTSCTGSSWDKVPETMKPWIQLRDSISVGRENWRYGQEQLLYHYTRDSDILLEELLRIRREGQS